MITFWTDTRGRGNFTNFLRGKVDATYPAITVARYEDLQHAQSVRSAAHIFSALDQLSPAGLSAVGSIWDQLARSAPQVRLLNDPRKVLHRYELLTALADAGLNRFRAHEAAGDLRSVRFPAFIREERRHTGAWSLLHDRRELDRALTALVARGFRREDLLVIEFCDTSDTSGVFRKYGALKIGDRILPRHMMIGREWMLKSSTKLMTRESALEELAYVRDNPHEAWLRRVFEIARIDYGRVDYAMLGDMPQLWEINLDPALGAGSRGDDARDPDCAQILKERRAIAKRAMAEAWHALEAADPLPSPTTITVARRTLRAVARERRWKQWRRKAIALGQWCADRPVVAWPLRWTYRRLFPGPTVFRMP